MKYLFTLVLLFALSGSVWGQEIQTPTFQGRTASDWGRLLSDRSPSIRATASNALRKMGENAFPALVPLTQALHDGDPRVVDDAIWALGLIGKDAASSVSHLAGIVAQKDHPSRIAATAALGLIGSSQGVALPVLGAAAKDEDPELRSAAALALGSIGRETDAVIPTLIQLTKDQETDVRHSAVLALGRLGPKAKAAAPALKSLEADASMSIRRDTKFALARIEGSPIPLEKVSSRTGSTNPPPPSENQTAQTVYKNPVKPEPKSEPANPVPSTYNRTSEPTRTEVARTNATVPPPTRAETVTPTVVRPMQILSREKPRYTELATRHKVAGDVVLNVQFRADGTVGEVTVLRGLGYGLDESAVQAAKRIKFIPAERDGKPIDSLNKVQYSFVQID
ncbi:MAG: TonB family protein [Blastocatellia bacterium]|nr:TonB family protein [Blastocatellia bacterium]